MGSFLSMPQRTEARLVCVPRRSGCRIKINVVIFNCKKTFVMFGHK